MKVDSRTAPIPDWRPIVVMITCESPTEMLAIRALLQRGAGVNLSIASSIADLMKPLAEQLVPSFTPL